MSGMRTLIFSLLFVSFLCSPNCSAESSDSAGANIERARAQRKAYIDSLESAESAFNKEKSQENQHRLWQALMAVAWYLDQTGEHRTAIEYSNRALDLAMTLEDNFRIGQSLAWLGWAYTALGLYESAQKFYSDALTFAAPQGVPKIIPVWGLAKQELGYLFFKMGDLASAKEFLGETTEYARKHHILIGVAEGGMRLAEIALHEGNLGAAGRAAEEAQLAAAQCQCTPFTEAHALTMLAEIATEKAIVDSKLVEQAKQASDKAFKYATEHHISRFVAEAQLLKARLMPREEFEKRYELTREAFELLSNMESERRGDAEVAVGRVFLEEANTKLAKFYIEHGIEVNERMLRTFNRAYGSLDLANLHSLKGEEAKALEKLKAGLDQALSAGALPAATEIQVKLFHELSRQGYTNAATDWGRRALGGYDSMILAESDVERKSQLEQKRLNLIEELGEETLSILPLSRPEKF